MKVAVINSGSSSVKYMADGEFEGLLNKTSGLKGICGANDMRGILQIANRGERFAQLAMELYCYRIKKYIGARFKAEMNSRFREGHMGSSTLRRCAR